MKRNFLIWSFTVLISLFTSCDKDRKEDYFPRFDKIEETVNNGSNKVVFTANHDDWSIGSDVSIHIGDESETNKYKNMRKDTIYGEWFKMYSPDKQVVIEVDKNDCNQDRKIFLCILKELDYTFLVLTQKGKQ